MMAELSLRCSPPRMQSPGCGNIRRRFLGSRCMVQPPSAPVNQPRGLRGDYSRAAADYTLVQDWERYSPDEHAIWATLYSRQISLIERYAAPEVLAGVRALGASASQIPRFED